MRNAVVIAFFLLMLLSCGRNDQSIVGRWTVEKVNVDFDEHIATPEMVKMLGEMEKDNVIEIRRDSTLVFISEGDTLVSRCTLRGEQLLSDGKPFGNLNDGLLVKTETTPLGIIRVTYSKQKP